MKPPNQSLSRCKDDIFTEKESENTRDCIQPLIEMPLDENKKNQNKT